MGASRYQTGQTLGQAHDNGSVVTVACQYCRTRRHYLPDDLRKLLGDIEAHAIARGSPCERCGRRDYLVAKVWHPIAEERIGLVVRRLERVVTIRRAVWRDEWIG